MAGITTGINRLFPSWEILNILAKMGNTGKYDFLLLFHSIVLYVLCYLNEIMPYQLFSTYLCMSIDVSVGFKFRF